jgi:hypothetical protein
VEHVYTNAGTKSIFFSQGGQLTRTATTPAGAPNSSHKRLVSGLDVQAAETLVTVTSIRGDVTAQEERCIGNV